MKLIYIACLVGVVGCTTMPEQRKHQETPFEAHGSLRECSPITDSQNISQARKTAILKAQGRIARSHNLIVSGEEHINFGESMDNQYQSVIEEESFGYLRPIIILNETIVVEDKAKKLCVSVREKVIE